MKATLSSMAFAVGCLLLGLGALYSGSQQMLLSLRLAADGETVSAAIVQSARVQRRNSKTRLKLELEYVDHAGISRRIESLRPLANIFPVDETAPVPVRYLRFQPERGLVDSLWGRWLRPILTLIVGGIATYFGLVALRKVVMNRPDQA